MDAVRAKLEQLIAARRESFARISALIGRNSSYIQQYIRRGTPRTLDEQDRRILAHYFGVSEEELGGNEGPPLTQAPAGHAIAVPILSLGASTGHGALEEQKQSSASMCFDSRWLRALGVKPGRVSIIPVQGESMAPTLCDGDEIMIDHDDGASRMRDGIYGLRLDGVLMVKRVVMGPLRGQLSVGSDNPAYPQWKDIDPDAIVMIGRVVWYGRRLHRCA